MVYRKGELTLHQVRREWPICIVVPRDLWSGVMQFMARNVASRGKALYDVKGEQLVVLFLKDQDIADHIMRFCDGWPYDPSLLVEGFRGKVMHRPVD